MTQVEEVVVIISLCWEVVALHDGTRLPPFVAYKGKNLWNRWMKGGPSACMYSVSDSGWMESGNFLEWFQKMFLPAVKLYSSKLPVVLFFDGHHSHMSLKLIKVARNNNVHLMCFPPHCTHILQPLDVAVFGPLKATWRNVLKEHQLKTCAANVTKEDFPSLLANLWKDSFLSQHLINGFSKSGLCPLSREAIPASKLLKALPHSHGPIQESQKKISKDNASQPEDSGKSEITVKVTAKCTINNVVTPIRLYLRGYFSKLLKDNKPCRHGGPASKYKTKPRFYGEALTLDDVYERMEEEEREKKQLALEKEQRLSKKCATKASCKVSKKKTPVLATGKAKKKYTKQFSPQQRPKRNATKKTLPSHTASSDLSETDECDVRICLPKRKDDTKTSCGNAPVKATRKIQKKFTNLQPLLQQSSKKTGRKTLPTPSSSDLSATDVISDDEDDGVCEECGKCYQDDNGAMKQCWMGCDTCEKWFHYQCIGLTEIPKGTWSCKYCF